MTRVGMLIFLHLIDQLLMFSQCCFVVWLSSDNSKFLFFHYGRSKLDLDWVFTSFCQTWVHSLLSSPLHKSSVPGIFKMCSLVFYIFSGLLSEKKTIVSILKCVGHLGHFFNTVVLATVKEISCNYCLGIGFIVGVGPNFWPIVLMTNQSNFFKT